MALAEQVMCILHQDPPKDGAQIANEAPARVRCEVVLCRHVFIYMMSCKAIDGAVSPEDQKDGNGDQDCNGQRFQVETCDDAEHCTTEKEQPLLH